MNKKIEINGARVGFGITGSFCTFAQLLPVLERLVALGANVTPILSQATATWDTRFFQAATFRQRVEGIAGIRALDSIQQVEPIGPKNLLDIMVVAPCTGNSLAKLACGIVDTPVVMACKSHLRNNGPVLLAVSSNDALGNNAANIGQLMNAKNIYFVPYGQDDAFGKPRSMVADFNLIPESIIAALNGEQLQPILIAGGMGK